MGLWVGQSISHCSGYPLTPAAPRNNSRLRAISNLDVNGLRFLMAREGEWLRRLNVVFNWLEEPTRLEPTNNQLAPSDLRFGLPTR